MALTALPVFEVKQFLAQTRQKLLGKFLVSIAKDKSLCYNPKVTIAGMMELADVTDSKSVGSDTVRVRPPLPAPKKKDASASFFLWREEIARGSKARAYVGTTGKNSPVDCF